VKLVVDYGIGMKYFILHGDLQPSHVMITAISIQRAKLTDFGLSPILKKGARVLGGSLSFGLSEAGCYDLPQVIGFCVMLQR